MNEQVPLMIPGEESEFDYILTLVPTELALGTKQQFRNSILHLQRHPDLEFRVVVCPTTSWVRVRHKDWDRIVAEQQRQDRENRKRAFWRELHWNCQLAAIGAIIITIVLLLLCAGAEAILGLSPNYETVYFWTLFGTLAVRAVQLAYEYVHIK